MPTAKTAWVDFKEIKAKVSIVQILERYGVLETLTRSGNNDRLTGTCPIHGGTNKTHFRASISKNCWNCFGKCQCGGNIIDFVMKKEDVSFRDAALLIQEWFIGEPVEKAAVTDGPRLARKREEKEPPQCQAAPPPNESSAELEDEMPNKPLAFGLTKLDQEHPYLQERGLTPESIATFGLGYCSKGLLRGYIAIPIHNPDGDLVAYAGRWPGTLKDGQGKYKLPKGFKKSLEVFNLHRAMLSDQEAPLVIVEGFFDCIRIHQAGYERVVAIMGTSLSNTQESVILESVNEKGVIVFFDNDEAGRKGQAEAMCRLATHGPVRTILAKGEGRQPEHLSVCELHTLLPLQQ